MKIKREITSNDNNREAGVPTIFKVEEDGFGRGRVFVQASYSPFASDGAFAWLSRAEAVQLRDALTEVIDSLPTHRMAKVRMPIDAELPEGWEEV